jgi:hypothetical protein
MCTCSQFNSLPGSWFIGFNVTCEFLIGVGNLKKYKNTQNKVFWNNTDLLAIAT